MTQEMTALNASIREELARAGYPRDYLQPVYRCPVCRDTGYVGEPVHEMCACLRRDVMLRLYSSEGLQSLERENFRTFREEVFPDIPVEGHKSTQRGYAKKLRDYCERYADAFTPKGGSGILLCGRTGLGKTFLMNCIAERVLDRGFSVVMLSAYRLLEEMRRYQFEGEGEETIRDVLSCDLLCIDDLGSEPMLRGVTVMEPSVTSNFTLVKLGLVLVNMASVRPICVVPTSVRVAAAVPVKEMSSAVSRLPSGMVTV